MNFLAHLYLAKNDPHEKIGNFIADAIKGKNYKHLPIGVQNGIIHHRAIDTFTDTHDIVKISKRRLDPKYGHFKAVIIDIIYDHYLAKNWQQYANSTLDSFTQDTYQILTDHYSILPEKTQYLLPFMKEQNWLYNYQTVEGISKILWGMNKRTKGIAQMDLAKFDLEQHYDLFEQDFTSFFKELMYFSDDFLEKMNSQK